MPTKPLPKAPITEALIDIIFQPFPFVMDNLDKLCDELIDDYPIKEGKIERQVNIDFGANNTLTHDNQKFSGYILKNNDKTNILQIADSRFTFSRLKPYENWISLKQEAQRIYNMYEKHCKPEQTARIAIRYINKINLPFRADLDEYFTCAPKIPEELPQGLTEYMSRLVIPEPSLGATAIVNWLLMPSEKIESNEDVMPMIFDIDVFKNQKLSASSSRLWDLLDELRIYKNNIFFKNLPPKTLELFK